MRAPSWPSNWKSVSSSPTYHDSESPSGLITPVVEIEALVVRSAVLVRVICQDDDVALMSSNTKVGLADSILTPGVVTLTIMSIRLLSSLISSIVSLLSTRKERVLAPAV